MRKTKATLKKDKPLKKVLSKPKTKGKKVVVQTLPKLEKETPRILGLENLKAPKGAHKKRKILGRGPSSGHGKTSTRGSKGQTSRAGRDFYLGFEGGQTPLIRRFPKRGFFNINRKEYQVVNLEALSKLKTTEVTPELLKQEGLIKSSQKLVKILGKASLTTALKVKAHAFSQSAKEAIKKAGGTIELISKI
jgi:large subunit ribosomal protein L15